MLLEGKAVQFDELGIFKIGLETEGKNTAAEFTANDIKGVRMNLFLGRRFRARQLLVDATFKEADRYVGFDDDDNKENGAVDPGED